MRYSNKLFLALDPEIQTAMKKLEIRLGSKNDYKKGGNDSGKNKNAKIQIISSELI